MKILRKKFDIGKHIISLPIFEPTAIDALFPLELAGSQIEKLNSTGYWSTPETIYYDNGVFSVSESYKTLQPFETIRLTLKRSITVEWEVDFRSLSGLKRQEIIFESGFNYHEALLVAGLSKLVYENSETIHGVISSQYDFDEVNYFSVQNHQEALGKSLLKLLWTFFNDSKSIVDLQFLYLLKNNPITDESLIIVIFQGSKEIEDWATNLSSKDVGFLSGGQVHKGFESGLKLFIETLNKQGITLSHAFNSLSSESLKEINQNTKIILAGHSLGGAVATLAGCHLIESGYLKENLDVYTFGAPPVGNRAFCDHFQDRINIFRIINQNDIIPKLEKITRFFHVGEEIVLPSNQGEKHSCNDYIDNLIDYIERIK